LNDPRFDSIARALASGQSRRALVKAVLALAGGAAAGAGIESASAARRPTPTPKPVKCPGTQVWDGERCVCEVGETCGSDCCPAEAMCCDNACCYGTCYGEELCCPSAREWCTDSGECCPDGWSCCPGFGCIENGSCCGDADCPLTTCAASVCLEDHTCSELIPDCTLGGSVACCGAGEICHSDGSCNPAFIDLTFVPFSDYCWPSVALTGFDPNHQYIVGFGGFRGSSPIGPIGRDLTTDQTGAFTGTFNIAYLEGDLALATIETVTSELVTVSCE